MIEEPGASLIESYLSMWNAVNAFVLWTRLFSGKLLRSIKFANNLFSLALNDSFCQTRSVLRSVSDMHHRSADVDQEMRRSHAWSLAQ